MFTDEEFATLRTFLQENNPKLAHDPGKMSEEMRKLDTFIDTELIPNPGKDNTEEISIAINISLQGRNMMARMIGEPERPMPEVPGIAPADPDPILDKHVVVWAGGSDSCFSRAVRQVINDTRVIIYDTTNLMVSAVLNGKVCGIVSMSPSGKAETNVESLVRHEIKNRKDWNYERAQALTLAPCADFSALELMPMANCIGKMLTGEYMLPTDKYELTRDLPRLTALMYQTKKVHDVAVVDDQNTHIANGIARLLSAWPKVRWVIMDGRQLHSSGYEIKKGAIVLLDEDLDEGHKGVNVATTLRKHGHTGMIVSISGGGKPSHVSLHFQAKATVATDRSSAEGFVKFMNIVLRQADSQ